MPTALQRYEEWRSRPDLDGALAAELAAIDGDAAAIEDRFYRTLAFGTGGLRGVLGAGTNRMNIYTVARATRGLAAYLHSQSAAPACAVAYDSRNQSDRFARVTAAVLAGAGVQVHLYEELMPTPMLSFAVRALSCTAGVVITASHNPARYNGYKVYGADGCQITLDAAAAVLRCIDAEPDFAPIPDFAEMLSAGRVQYIGRDVIDAYDAAVLAQCPGPLEAPLKVAYSPLNGTGNKPVRRALAALGVEVCVVKEQENPDGDFPTCPYPNPEIPQAMALAVQLCRDSGADFCLATDPDCDRVGAAALDERGEIRMINGNEMGVLLLDYLCKTRLAAGTMPPRPVAVKTIVTTEMAAAVAQKYGLELRNVLTGFKFIGEQIGLLEAAGQAGRFVFGFEESYGYLSGSYVRDKDGVDGAVLICAMAAHHKARGLTLPGALAALEAEYGCWRTALLSFEFDGAAGMETMNRMLDGLRAGHDAFAGRAVEEMTDYLNDDTGLPRSNVLRMALAGGCTAVVRPSGTEPKLKIYRTARARGPADAGAALDAMARACSAWAGQPPA